MNQLSIIGRLTEEPSLKKTANGTAVCHFRIARNEKHGAKEKAIFIDVTAWDKQAECITQYLHKGDQVAVSGRLDYSEYTDSEGNKRTKHSIVAHSTEFLAKKNGKDTHASTDTKAHTSTKAAEVVEEVMPF